MIEQPHWLPADRPWPVNLCAYDRAPELSAAEKAALGLYAASREIHNQARTQYFHASLQRLVRPLRDVMDLMAPCKVARTEAINGLLREVYRRRQALLGMDSSGLGRGPERSCAS
jgi:hypothetical protein